MEGIKEVVKTINSKVELSYDEISEKLKQINALRNEIVELIFNIKEARAVIKQKQGIINNLLEEVCSGKANKEIEAKIIIDFDKRIKTIVDLSDGKIIEEKELEPTDLQEELLLDAF